MVINRFLTMTALALVGGLVISLPPTGGADAQSRRERTGSAQACDQYDKGCKARERRAKKAKQYRRWPRKDFWEEQRENQRG